MTANDTTRLRWLLLAAIAVILITLWISCVLGKIRETPIQKIMTLWHGLDVKPEDQ